MEFPAEICPKCLSATTGPHPLGCTPSMRFWFKVERCADGCWRWRGSLSEFGYGRLVWGGRSTYAHRVSWQIANGPIPRGMQVLHRCDTPSCIRPTHLFLGTQQDNVNDMTAKGRRNDFSKITRSQAQEIRAARQRGIPIRSLMQTFGIKQAQVSRIANGSRWKDA